jgi:hypothetical protein
MEVEKNFRAAQAGWNCGKCQKIRHVMHMYQIVFSTNRAGTNNPQNDREKQEIIKNVPKFSTSAVLKRKPPDIDAINVFKSFLPGHPSTKQVGSHASLHQRLRLPVNANISGIH